MKFALFLIGSPGSGKNIIIENHLKDYHLREITVTNFSKNVKLNESLLLSGNGYDYSKISTVKTLIESEGYKTCMIYVDVNEDISRTRCSYLQESIRSERYTKSKSNITKFKALFENFILFNNNIDISSAGNQLKKVYEDNMRKVSDFILETCLEPPKRFDIDQITEKVLKNYMELMPNFKKDKESDKKPEKNVPMSNNPDGDGIGYEIGKYPGPLGLKTEGRKIKTFREFCEGIEAIPGGEWNCIGTVNPQTVADWSGTGKDMNIQQPKDVKKRTRFQSSNETDKEEMNGQS